MNFLKDTRKLVMVAILSALAAVLAFIEVPYPIPPASAWLKFDVSEVPVIVAASSIGYIPMATVAFIRSFVRLMSGWNTSSTVFGLAEGIAFISSITIGTSFYLGKKFINENFLKRKLVMNNDTAKLELELSSTEKKLLTIFKKISFYSLFVVGFLTLTYCVSEIFSTQIFNFNHDSNFQLNVSLTYLMVYLASLIIIFLLYVYFNQKNLFKNNESAITENINVLKARNIFNKICKAIIVASSVVISFLTIVAVTTDALPNKIINWTVKTKEFDWHKTIRFKLGFTPANTLLFLGIVAGVLALFYLFNKDKQIRAKVSGIAFITTACLMLVIIIHASINNNFNLYYFPSATGSKDPYRDLTYYYHDIFQFFFYLLGFSLGFFFIINLSLDKEKNKLNLSKIIVTTSIALCLLLTFSLNKNFLTTTLFNLNFDIFNQFFNLRIIFWLSFFIFIISYLGYLGLKYVKSTSDFLIATLVVISLTFVLTALNFFITTPANLTAGKHWFFTSFVKDKSISGWGNGSTLSYTLIILGIYVPFNIIKGIFVMVVYYNIRKLEPKFED